MCFNVLTNSYLYQQDFVTQNHKLKEWANKTSLGNPKQNPEFLHGK